MYRPLPTSATHDGLASESGGDAVVTLDQVPCWSDAEFRLSIDAESSGYPNSYFPDPLAAASSGGGEGGGVNGMVSRFPVDHEINSKIYLWRGNPWNLEVDAVVNSTNEVSGILYLDDIFYLFFPFILCNCGVILYGSD